MEKRSLRETFNSALRTVHTVTEKGERDKKKKAIILDQKAVRHYSVK